MMGFFQHTKRDPVGYRLLCGMLMISLCITGFAPREKLPTSPNSLPVVQPPLLKKGDKIGIIAPSFQWCFTDKVIKKGKNIFQSWGLQVVVGRSVWEKSTTLFGADKVKVADLQHMLDDPTIKAIIAIRGGYGMTRIIDQLDFTKFLQYPKWVIGFSDITVLLAKLDNLKVASIHGEMVWSFPEAAYASSIASLRTLLFTGKTTLLAKRHTLNRPGVVKAPVVGGCLATICNNIGTSSAINTNGKILFLEDIGEKLYAIDKMMVQLKRAGKLSGLQGLVVGHMVRITNGDPVKFGKSAYDIIKAHVAPYQYPVAFNFPIGHIAPNRSLPHGRVGRLIVNEAGAHLSF